MSLFVHITEQCEKESKRHQVLEEVHRLRDRLLALGRVSLMDRFSAVFLKKRFKRQHRLVAEVRSVDDTEVLCFLRLFIRGDGQYVNGFAGVETDEERRRCVPDVTDEELRTSMKTERLREPLPSLSQEEAGLVYGIFGGGVSSRGDGDLVICESEDWVREAGESVIQDRHFLYQLAILDILAGKDARCGEVLFPQDSQYGLRYCYFPDIRRLFLGVHITPGVRRDRESSRCRDILHAESSSVDAKMIDRHSLRAYPEIILAGLDLWTSVERDAEANLALSPEEAEILDGIRAMGAGGQPCFPLFINGRAGSGKSTILQYLFAEYLDYYLRMDEQGCLAPPVYFTWSGPLLERARTTVTKIRESSHQMLLKRGRVEGVASDKSKDGRAESFWRFQEYLLSLLPEDRRARYQDSKRVGYSDFRKMWNAKYGQDPDARRYGPDLCWHVIRTYVKGFDDEDYLDLDAYEELPEKQRSVSPATFSWVSNRVWEGWYKSLCEQEGRWDDQDLAHELLAGDRVKPSFSAVFCDEAQDFTRIELELILRLSLYSGRSINVFEDIKRIPFAFAGDPFQTVNPTGFRWDAVQASFHEKVIQPLDPLGRSGIQFNYRELSYNYRSTRHVVRFCNLLQAFRAYVFDIRRLAPQEAWQREEGSPHPVSFRDTDPAAQKALQSQTDLTVIVPCEEGGEREYVEADPFLREAIRRDEDGYPINVMSPARAKGLEFGRVVLYKFGEACPVTLAAAWDQGPDGQNRETTLPLEYFMNKLYVAASRPKRRLYVIDTERGEAGLWRLCRSESVVEGVFGTLSSGGADWLGSVSYLMPGVPADWDADREDPGKKAEVIERDGLSAQDPYLLRSAAFYYMEARKETESRRCLARAFEMEGNLHRAGETYLTAGLPSESMRCFWSARQYGQVKAVGDRHAEIQQTSEYRVSDFLVNKSRKEWNDALGMLKEMHSVLASDPARRADSAWKDSWNDVVGVLVRQKTDVRDYASWAEAGSILESLERKGVRCNPLSKGIVLFYCGRLKEALDVWEPGGHRPKPEHWDATAAVTPYPEKIDILSTMVDKAGRWIEIVDEYEKHKDVPLSGERIKVVKKAYHEAGEISRGAGSMGASRQIEVLLASLDLALVAGNQALTLETLSRSAERMVAEGLIQEVLDLEAGKGMREYIELMDSGATREFVAGAKDGWGRGLVEGLAAHGLVGRQKKSLLEQLEKFLAQKVLPPGRGLPAWVDWRAAGAALERAGRITDGLTFYEIVSQSERTNPEEKRAAQERWLRCKVRQAEYEEKKFTEGGSTEARRRDLARQHREDAERAADRWGIVIAKVPEYPLIASGGRTGWSLEGLPEGRTCHVDGERGLVKWSEADLEYAYFPGRNKVIIQNIARAEVVTVDILEQKMDGSVSVSNDSGPRSGSRIQDWDLTIRFSETDQVGTSEVVFSHGGHEFRLRVEGNKPA
jgi:tetratricopeptide (TPR) repeat protein